MPITPGAGTRSAPIARCCRRRKSSANCSTSSNSSADVGHAGEAPEGREREAPRSGHRFPASGERGAEGACASRTANPELHAGYCARRLRVTGIRPGIIGDGNNWGRSSLRRLADSFPITPFPRLPVSRAQGTTPRTCRGCPLPYSTLLGRAWQTAPPCEVDDFAHQYAWPSMLLQRPSQDDQNWNGARRDSPSAWICAGGRLCPRPAPLCL